MFAGKALRCIVHGLPIQPPGDMPYLVAIQGRWSAAIENHIQVMAFDSRESGFKFIRDGRTGDNRYRMGPDVGIDGVPDDVFAPVSGQVNVGHLAVGMNASVCASGAMNYNCLAAHGSDSPFQRLLD